MLRRAIAHGLRIAAAAALATGCWGGELPPRESPAASGTAIRPTINGRAPCVVERVVDGDTMVCRGGSRVRLLTIDAPEAAQQPFGGMATAIARELMPAGDTVVLEFDVELHDRYDRILAYVHAGEKFVNRELVLRGAAVVAVYPPNVKHVEVLRVASARARVERAGVWGVDGFACLPADFRAGRCK